MEVPAYASWSFCPHPAEPVPTGTVDQMSSSHSPGSPSADRPAPPGADTDFRSSLFGSSEYQLCRPRWSVAPTQIATLLKAGSLHRAVEELPAAATVSTPLERA